MTDRDAESQATDPNEGGEVGGPMTAMPTRGERPVVEVFPIAIGDYADGGLPDLDVETQVGHVVDALAPFGGALRAWAHPARDRRNDAVQQRLREWPLPSESETGQESTSAFLSQRMARSSVLYWVGHGWSDGDQSALAHAGSHEVVGADGVDPFQLAYAIRSRQASVNDFVDEDEDGGGWAMVILDTCRSTAIADAITKALVAFKPPPERLMLVPVSSAGATSLGRFTNALTNLLTDTFRTQQRIYLRDLATQLERVLGQSIFLRGLGDAALSRTLPPVASLMSAPMDTIRHLEDVLNDLSPSERSHFFAKAQSAENGELSWFFEGRRLEGLRISRWLQSTTSGMFIVTGRAGSGKSALLGNLLVQSLPDLRDALARRGLITLPDPAELPPADVFDAVIHLSGLSLQQVTNQVAAAAGLGEPPSSSDSAVGVAGDLDWLTERLAVVLADQTGTLTILVDALDEAVDPLDTARSLLARIAAVPRVRVLVGTRTSTNETPDAPANDANLIDALRSANTDFGEVGATQFLTSGPESVEDDVGILRVLRDSKAIHRYVGRRLRHARTFGSGGRAINGMAEVRDADIDRVAAEISLRDKEFLYARLAVYELIEAPVLMGSVRASSLQVLLDGDHQDLFARALNRLAEVSDYFPPLMAALSLARGQGVPADGIWTTIATSLASEILLAQSARSNAPPDSREGVIESLDWTEAIHELLDRAAAYIVVDTQQEALSNGDHHRSTVYRLGHRTFVEFFNGKRRNDNAHSHRQRASAHALLGNARRIAADDPTKIPLYLIRHLSGHLADAGLWDDLAAEPRVLDGLRPDAVTADALRTLFGRRDIPAAIAGVIGARDALLTAAAADRAGLRQLASTTYSAEPVVGEFSHGWGVAAALAEQATTHVRLAGHRGPVGKVCAVSLLDGRMAIASASDDGSVRLWDPQSGTPIGAPMRGHEGTVENICAFSLPNGRERLASVGGDGTVRIWDPASGLQVGNPLTGHAGPVYGVCAWQDPKVDGLREGRVWLASVGGDSTVRIWDPVGGRQVGASLTGHSGTIYGVCSMPGGDEAGIKDGRTWIASAGSDGTVRVWDPLTGLPVGSAMTGHTGTIYGVCTVPGTDEAGIRDGQVWLASAGVDGSLRVWNPLVGAPVRPPMIGHDGPVLGVCTVSSSESSAGTRTMRLASAGSDASVRVWDPVTGEQVGDPSTGHNGPVYGICAVAGTSSRRHTQGQGEWLASAGGDGTVRIWDPETPGSVESRITRHDSPVYRVCAVPGTDVSGRQDGRTWIAAAGGDGSVRLWDPATGTPVGDPLAGHAGPVWGVCPVPGVDDFGRRDGRTWLASSSLDGTVRLWDPATRLQIGDPMTGHTGSVWAVCAVPGVDDSGHGDGRTWLASAGLDGTVRLWDPATRSQIGDPLTGHTGGVYGLCTIPGFNESGGRDGRTWLASSGTDASVRLWDPATGAQIGDSLTGHVGTVYGLCAIPGFNESGNPDGRIWLASSGTDGSMRLWDPATRSQIGNPLSGHTGGVYGLCAIPGINGYEAHGEMRLASAGDDGSVRIWDLVSGTAVATPLMGHIGAIRGVCVVQGLSGVNGAGTSDRRFWLASGGVDGSIRLWDVGTGDPLGEPMGGAARSVEALRALESPFGTKYAAVHSDGRLETWQTTQGKLTPFVSPFLRVSAVAGLESSTGVASMFVVADTAGFVNLVTPEGDTDDGSVQFDSGAVLDLQVLPGERPRIAAAGRDGVITIWATDSFGRTMVQLTGHNGPIRSLCFVRPANDVNLLASAGHDGTIRLWDIDTYQLRGRPLAGHDGAIWSLTTVPATGRSTELLASAGADKTIRLWDLAAGELFAAPITGHTDQVRAVAVAKAEDGRFLLLSGSHDGTVRLWQPTTGELVHSIPLGMPVHALLPQHADIPSSRRTDGGASIIVGLREGILTLDLNGVLFPSV